LTLPALCSSFFFLFVFHNKQHSLPNTSSSPHQIHWIDTCHGLLGKRKYFHLTNTKTSNYPIQPSLTTCRSSVRPERRLHFKINIHRRKFLTNVLVQSGGISRLRHPPGWNTMTRTQFLSMNPKFLIIKNKSNKKQLLYLVSF